MAGESTAGPSGEIVIMRMLHPFRDTMARIGKAVSLRMLAVAVAAALAANSVPCHAQRARDAVLPSSQHGTNTSANVPINPASIGGLTDDPISAGETVHILVFDAPDFSIVTRVSESGDIPYPMLGAVHIGGLTSTTAADLIAGELKKRNLMINPDVLVTVDSTITGITVLGEVHTPGIYPPPGKRMLSDILAEAGGLTANTGRVIEISNNRTPEKKAFIPWDPTMHNTDNYDRPIHPGDRVVVRACGFAYIGGHVSKPGAYSLCGSDKMTLSEVVAMAGGATPFTATQHTFIIRLQPDGTKVIQEVDLKKVLTGKVADAIIQEDDIVYVSPSPLKEVTSRALAFAASIVGPLLYVYNP
jgi:polysaccharide biosynthesis/export protein